MTAVPVQQTVNSATATIESTRRPAAHVIGLQRNLTAPTRDRAGHVDLWFETQWPSAMPAWTETFTQLAREGVHDAEAPVAEISAVPIGPERGFIVARGVPMTLDELAPVERLVRDLVSEANARALRTVASASPARRPGRKRWLRAFGVLFGA